tara:strand:- start:11 stop:712 length:702 start_codon:yes stop_codon:yes gene_type:complete
MESIHGTFDTIPLDDIIQNAKADLDIENTDLWDLRFSIWAEDALRSLNCQSLVVKKQECIDICDYKTPLPKGMYQFLGLRFMKDNACTLAIYADTAFLNSQCCLQGTAGDGWYIQNYFEAMQIQDGFMYFSNKNYFDSAVIAYMGFNTDDQGRLVIYTRYKRAIEAYLRWKFMKKKRGKFTRAEWSDEYKEYCNQQSWLKGEDNSIGFNNYRREVQAAWLSLVVSPIINTFGH